MAKVNGQIVTCDRCGKHIFLKCTGEGERDGGFTRWNKFESLPDGYNTILTDDGINISKGQRQLITIARAMISNSQMLILDEATSNVDSRTEIKIQEAMNELMKNKTCFVIAHRLSTIQNADLILVLQNGIITEQGNHEELLAQKGFYSTLYNSQFNSGRLIVQNAMFFPCLTALFITCPSPVCRPVHHLFVDLFVTRSSPVRHLFVTARMH